MNHDGPVVSLGALAAAMLPAHVGRPEFPPVAALASYFDDSKNGRIYDVAGYVSHVEVWDSDFVPAWRRVIDGAPHRVSEFKASDCRQGRGEFENWTQGERRQFTKDLVSVLVETCPNEHLVGMANVVLLPGGGQSKKARKAIEDLGMLMCITLAMHDLLDLAKKVFLAAPPSDADEVQIVFDEQACRWAGPMK